MAIDQSAANAMADLLRELASELDLHYEDADLLAIEPTIERMKRAAKLIADSGYPVPESYQHIVGRFDRRATRQGNGG